MKKIFYFVYIAGFILSLISCSTEMGIKSEELSVTLERDTFYCGEMCRPSKFDDYFRVSVKDANDKEIVLKYGDYFLQSAYPQDTTTDCLVRFEGSSIMFTSNRPQDYNITLVYTVRSSGNEGAYFNEGKKLYKSFKVRFIQPANEDVRLIKIDDSSMYQVVTKPNFTKAVEEHFSLYLNVTLTNGEVFLLDYQSPKWTLQKSGGEALDSSVTAVGYNIEAKYLDQTVDIGKKIYVVDP